jgi:hypothetical protein
MTRATWLALASLLLVACALAAVSARDSGKRGDRRDASAATGRLTRSDLAAPHRTVRTAVKPSSATGPSLWDNMISIIPARRGTPSSDQQGPDDRLSDNQDASARPAVTGGTARETLPMVGAENQPRTTPGAGTSSGSGFANASDGAVSSSTGAASPAGDFACAGQAPFAQPHGVTANVSFVGVLLNGTERAGRTFSSRELGDLKIRVEWQNLFQNHRQRLDLVAPDGSLYQSLSRPLIITDVAAPVETLLPVNGTWITRYGLFGTWCVKVFFDEDDAPVSSSRLVISAR